MSRTRTASRRTSCARFPSSAPGAGRRSASSASVRDTSDAAELTRENLRPVVRVTGAVDLSRSNLGSVMRGVRRATAGLPLPAGVTLELGGQYAGQRQAFRQLLLVFGLAAGAVLLVLVGQFRDVRGPIAIMAVAVLGLAGAVAALALTGIPFNVSSFMGLILLIGLVVKNGVIFLDAALHRAGEGLAAHTRHCSRPHGSGSGRSS